MVMAICKDQDDSNSQDADGHKHDSAHCCHVTGAMNYLGRLNGRSRRTRFWCFVSYKYHLRKRSIWLVWGVSGSENASKEVHAFSLSWFFVI